MLTQARKSLNVAGFSLKFRVARYMKLVAGELGCDKSHFSLLLAAGNILGGVTSVTQSDRNSILMSDIRSLVSKYKFVQFYISSG